MKAEARVRLACFSLCRQTSGVPEQLTRRRDPSEVGQRHVCVENPHLPRTGPRSTGNARVLSDSRSRQTGLPDDGKATVRPQAFPRRGVGPSPDFRGHCHAEGEGPLGASGRGAAVRDQAQGRLTAARRSAPGPRPLHDLTHAVRLGQDCPPSTAKTEKLRSIHLLREKEPKGGRQPVPKVWRTGRCREHDGLSGLGGVCAPCVARWCSDGRWKRRFE